MANLMAHLKGLLLKSFFVLFVFSFELNAKTLIFQSNESSGSTSSAVQSDNAVESESQSRSPSSVMPPVSSAPASNANSELFFMVEQLKQEVMMLRGLLEEQSFAMRQLQERSKDRYRDTDERIQSLVQKIAVLEKAESSVVIQSSAPVVSPPVVSPPVVNPGGPDVVAVNRVVEETDEQKVAYQKAYNLVKEKNFPEAIDALHAYVENYPEGDLTGNAFYWLGEVYLVLPKLEQARQAFTIVVKTFPGHRKLADSIYKLAVTYDRLQKPAEAELYLKQVQEQFPNSTAAKLAQNYKITR